MKNNVILIGMPGCGKSAIGRLAAKELGMVQIDGDDLINAHEGTKTLEEIIRAHGTDYFKELEEHILSTVELDRTILAPGGSVCYYPKAFEHFNEIADVVYLEVSEEELKRRINQGYLKRHPGKKLPSEDEVMLARGIVFKPGQDFDSLYKERTPLYEKYTGLKLNSTGLSKEETTQRLLQLLRELP